MKFEKQVSLKWAIALVLIACLVSSSIVYYVFAVSPSSAFTISSGVYPGAPSYTVWREGSNYFAKDANGEIDYSGTNASAMIQTIIYALPDGGKIFIRAGDYDLTSLITLKEKIWICGEGEATNLRATTNVKNFLIQDTDNITLSDFKITVTYATRTASDHPVIQIKATNSYIEHVNFRNLWIVDSTKTNRSAGPGSYTAIDMAAYADATFGYGIAFCSFQNIFVRDIEVAFGLCSFKYGTIEGFINGNHFDHLVLGGFTYGWQTIDTASAIDDNVISNSIFQQRRKPLITYYGVNIKGHRNCVKNCEFFNDDLGANTTYYAIDIVSGTRNLIEGGLVDGLIRNLGDKTIFRDITNFVTENSGATTISASTTVTFNHGLAGTPTGVWASFSSTAVTGWKWTATSTSVTITVTPSGTYTVYWYAEYKP
jgi:hypothetical protein